MNMKFATFAVLGTLGLVAAAPRAEAADNGFYLGAGLTQTKFDIDDVGSDKLDDNSFKVIAGIRPLDWLAFEANYLDLGGETKDGVSLDTRAVTASALLLKEFAVIDLYARVGVAKWDADVAISEIGRSSDDGWEPTYGVGIGAHFGSVGVRAEYERFEADLFDDLKTKVDTVSVSVTYTFL
ncbi:MAG TPA: porin family protein [Steroidobacteraceae bacterium]|nr:porin family protein [Steroidobacteraceae bacterium]